MLRILVVYKRDSFEKLPNSRASSILNCAHSNHRIFGMQRRPITYLNMLTQRVYLNLKDGDQFNGPVIICLSADY